jgi:hypothetical protein
MIDPVTGMLIGGGISMLGQYLGGNQQAEAMKASAKAQERMQREAIAEQRQAFDDVSPNYDPYMQAGLQGLQGMGQDYSTDMGEFEYNKDISDFSDPSRDFQMQQMQDAMEQSAVAKGGLQSGGFAKALQDRAGQFAQTSYGQDYNRMNQDKATSYQQFRDQFASRRANNQQRLNQFQNMAQMGQQATSGLANLRTGNANQISGNLQNIGTAQGQGAQADGMVYGQMVQNMTSPQNLMGAYQTYNSLSNPQSNSQGVNNPYNQLQNNQYSADRVGR